HGLRRPVADRLGRLRSGGRGAPGPGGERAGARLRAHRHRHRRGAGTAATGSAAAAGGLDAMSTVHLVDASLYVFRAWHAMPDEFHDAGGWPVNAVHGFARFLLDLLERQKPGHIAVAFDEALDSCFRNQLYPAYKANRDPAPEELKRQFGHCQRLCRALGLPVLADARYEADDLIGSTLSHVRQAGHHGLIISADKDLSQLLAGRDQQWD